MASTQAAAEVLPKLKLSELAGVLAQATGVVGVDTGLAHLASALEKPGVFLYGPTNIQLTGVLGQGQRTLQTDLECVPCLKRRCPRRDSSNGEPVCLQQLSPEQVFRALEESLQSSE